MEPSEPPWRVPRRLRTQPAAGARGKKGRITFQVGPTVYRGLWVVDGNFILEAARYLGYDAEAQQGLETTWKHQDASGGVFAGGGREHWKDTGIAMFTLVRQAELSQDWSYFREMQPNVERAVKFLVSVRDKAKSDGSVNGRYGLLAPGFGDGGLGGIRSEFTNTVWVLAGLKAVTEATDSAWSSATWAGPSCSTTSCERRSSRRRARRCAAIPRGSITCPCW